MDIWQFDLRRGSSRHPREGACLLDAVSWFEYGKLGDNPPCVCPVIVPTARIVNDLLPDDKRQELKPFILQLSGTVDPAAEQERAQFLALQAICKFVPCALEAAALLNPEHMVKLRRHVRELQRQKILDDGAIKAITRASHTIHAIWHAAADFTIDTAFAAAAAANSACTAVMADDIIVVTTTTIAAAKATEVAVTKAACAANAAKTAARAVNYAATENKIYDLAIAALEGVLKIGKQAPLINIDAINRANRSFALARMIA